VSEPDSDEPGEKIEVLRTLLESASRIAGELASGTDPVVAQLSRIIKKAPPEDLNVLLGVLEREIDAKADADLTADAMTGLSLRPNPNARLYTRVIDREPTFERHEVILAAVRAVRSIHQTVEERSVDWYEVAEEALRTSTPEERESAAKFCRLILEFIETIDRDLAAGGARQKAAE
jgi:hypothetical protein